MEATGAGTGAGAEKSPPPLVISPPTSLVGSRVGRKVASSASGAGGALVESTQTKVGFAVGVMLGAAVGGATGGGVGITMSSIQRYA